MPAYSCSGVCPPKQVDFLRKTGRTWGYWVMNDREQIIIYSPTPCIHLEKGLCGIYDNRPEVCEPYFCKRYPILPEDTT
jgi:Fe-S-cluster containining protein